jgi:hypothetical protein
MATTKIIQGNIAAPEGAIIMADISIFKGASCENREAVFH